MPAWRSFEDRVRLIASLRWKGACVSEHIHGVDFDGVCRPSPDEIVVIEMTTERTLEKVRGDVNKILPFKIKQLNDGVLCRGYVVLQEEPSRSMREFGRESRVSVCSLAEFEAEFFDFSSYKALREGIAFGSAIDSRTGENDPRSFVQVRYAQDGARDDLSIVDIANKLIRGERLVLTGDYGTGKSRCVREVFSVLSDKVMATGAYPVAINLRDHWSGSNALEIIAGHVGNLGLNASVDNLMRLLNNGGLILLLDGFDEIGAQVYDPKARDRKSLRRHAVRGVRDLIQRSKAGVLVTGRSHFFDSDREMLESLGLGNRQPFVVRVPSDFTEDEAKQYLVGLGVGARVPRWLPRKPLVFQLLAEITSSEVNRLLSDSLGEFEFWSAFIYAVCMRESRGVAESISAETIRDILLELAALTRFDSAFLGRLVPSEIDKAYEAVVGSTPDETGRLLLARLCALGRIEPESPDRQFIDPSLIDVLRAEYLVGQLVAPSDAHLKKRWVQGLKVLGTVYAAGLVQTYELQNACFTFLRKYGAISNQYMVGEIVSVLSIAGDGQLDLGSLQVIHGYVPVLNLHRRSISNVAIRSSEIGVLDIDRTNVSASNNILIEDCIIISVVGVSSYSGMPEWIRNPDVISFDNLSNAAAIKQSEIAGANKLLLVLIHKIFFQPGSGREEAALRKGGFGQEYSSKLVGKILGLLMREGVIDKHKGDEGWVYTPVRSATARMNRIRSELSLSKDKIWIETSRLRD